MISHLTAPPPSAPHSLSANSVPRIMLTVLLTLVPATLFGFWLYGWPAIFLWIVTVLAALFGEATCLRLAGNKATPTLLDGSALVTGWLLALSLPPWAPWWIGVFGATSTSLKLRLASATATAGVAHGDGPPRSIASKPGGRIAAGIGMPQTAPIR